VQKLRIKPADDLWEAKAWEEMANPPRRGMFKL